MKNKYTFKQWCLDRDRQDLLNRWDYEKTGFGPEDITYASNKPVYFKCPNGLHESEKRVVCRITTPSSDQKDFKCKKCLGDKAVNFEDLTGKQFNELTVLYLDKERNDEIKSKGRKSHQTYWICECSCGRKCSTYSSALKDGSQKTCGDKSYHQRGENNGNWKGGITPNYICERTSKQYNEWRDATYKKDWFTCQCCGKYGSNVEKNAHHIKNFSEYEELKYDLSNSITMCAECHHIKFPDSFHSIYGTRNNNEEQLVEYINNKRKQLGIPIPFNIDEYRKGNILKPDAIETIRAFMDEWRFIPYINLKYMFGEKREKKKLTL